MVSGQQMSCAGCGLCGYRDWGSVPTLLGGPEQVASPLWACFLLCEDGIVGPQSSSRTGGVLCRLLLAQLRAFKHSVFQYEQERAGVGAGQGGRWVQAAPLSRPPAAAQLSPWTSPLSWTGPTTLDRSRHCFLSAPRGGSPHPRQLWTCSLQPHSVPTRTDGDLHGAWHTARAQEGAEFL